jgi:MoxR-like ATPase
MSEAIEEYIVQLVLATRKPKPYGEDISHWLRYGASPRATISLDRCARAHAWLQGKDYVAPEDIHAIAHDVLRHRILLAYEAQAHAIDTDQFIDEILKRVPSP